MLRKFPIKKKCSKEMISVFIMYRWIKLSFTMNGKRNKEIGEKLESSNEIVRCITSLHVSDKESCCSARIAGWVNLAINTVHKTVILITEVTLKTCEHDFLWCTCHVEIFFVIVTQPWQWLKDTKQTPCSTCNVILLNKYFVTFMIKSSIKRVLMACIKRSPDAGSQKKNMMVHKKTFTLLIQYRVLGLLDRN